MTTLLDAVSDAAPFLARGDNERFMSEVARLTATEEPSARKQPKDTVLKPTPVRHPAGERVNKQQNALAANLKKWLAVKADKDGGEK